MFFSEAAVRDEKETQRQTSPESLEVPEAPEAPEAPEVPTSGDEVKDKEIGETLFIELTVHTQNVLVCIMHVTCKTCTCLKSHCKWAYRRLRATQLLVILPLVLNQKGLKGPRKSIQDPYTDCPALSQEQPTTSSQHFLRQTKPPKGGPETTSVMDNVSQNKTCPLVFFGVFFSGPGGEGEKGSTEAPKLTYLPAPCLYDYQDG
jgi:hypothetical protein